MHDEISKSDKTDKIDKAELVRFQRGIFTVSKIELNQLHRMLSNLVVVNKIFHLILRIDLRYFHFFWLFFAIKF